MKILDRYLVREIVPPFLLAHFHAATGGASVVANVGLVLANAGLGGRIAVAIAGPAA